MIKIAGKAFLLVLLLISLTTMTGCQIIGDIFKAGFWAGVILVLFIAAVIGFVFSRFRK